MPYSITGGAILEIQIVGQLHGQTTRTVFHYLKQGSDVYTNGQAAAQALLTDFGGRIYTPLMGITSEQWTLLQLQAQWIVPTRYRAFLIPATGGVLGGGTVSGPSAPSAVSMVVSAYAELSGRSFRGRKYFPGVPAEATAGSILDNTTLTSLQDDVAAAMTQHLTSGIYDVAPTLGMTDVATAASQVITSTIARSILRYQRRREVGVGE